MDALRESWDELVPGAGALGDELLGRYRGRGVYRERYLAVVLKAVGALEQLATDPVAVGLAAWLHRAEHARGNTAAEDAEASARLAEESLPGCGVSDARVAEVARLVRLSGGIGAARTPDPNGDVLLDAVNAMLADRNYLTHAGELRRDAAERPAVRRHAGEQAAVRRDADERDTGERDAGELTRAGRNAGEQVSGEQPADGQPGVRDRGVRGAGGLGAGHARGGGDAVAWRYGEVRGVLGAARIFRTGVGFERFEADARVNLAAELETLDGMIPHPWRGWQRAGLGTVAVLTAVLAVVVALGAAQEPWRVPKYSGDSHWPAVVLTLVAATSVALVYWAVRRSDRRARIVAAVPALVGIVGVLTVWITMPDTNEVSGVGARVPLLVIASVLLIVAGAVAIGATLTRPTSQRTRGQVLAGAAAFVVVVLLAAYVVDPVQRAYLLSANEYLDGQHQPADMSARSDLTGALAWTTSGTLEGVIGTAHGIAVPRSSGSIEMLDPATGKLRWTYTRSDTEDRPHLYALKGGEKLLASYDDIGYFVLDADTGKREAAWTTDDRDIQNTDPLLTGQTVSKGSDKLYGANPDGSDRWTFKPGTCTAIDATATADTVVAELDKSCGDPDQLVGLNLKTGKKLWTHDTDGGRLITTGDRIVQQQAESTLVGIDPSSGAETWRWSPPKEWTCRTNVEPAGNLLLVISCPSEEQARTTTVVTALDAATGRPAWTQTAPAPSDQRYAVTADGRVAILWDQRGYCRLTSITQQAVTTRQLQDAIHCYAGITAAGDLVLAGGNDKIIALR
ncbi:PQQ-binding-like beta-propeller repeat protein [Kribbella sp. NPDC026611]|uniref:outer membrane protein assembly factor BamB family protein n=1 Tax=Kribbella sp. NPDC026611 TaxID=3154911 RepID=UPI0033CB8E90